ncbi:hypothetical protein OG389_08650 [Streptomyces sp. NBC_00435]|uniref:hypothetical protein n=1 Tax=Streptomyces sp. NBC_00435 TaxID=2903649 RepID=UPI002E1A9C2A
MIRSEQPVAFATDEGETAWLTTALAVVVAAAARVTLVMRRAALAERTGRWEVRATRDPALGPA